MTDPNDPNKPEDTPDAADTDPVSPDPGPAFISSRPPAAERTLLGRVRAFAECEHPKGAQSPAIVVEPNGSKMAMCWCGMCGAVRLDEGGVCDWIRPGLAQVIRDDDHLALLASRMAALVDGLARLSKIAGTERVHAKDSRDPNATELSPGVPELESACAEVERLARAALNELGL